MKIPQKNLISKMVTLTGNTVDFKDMNLLWVIAMITRGYFDIL